MATATPSSTGSGPDGPAHEELGAGPDVVVFDVGEVVIDETRVWSVWAHLVGVSPLTFAAVLGAAIVQGLDWQDALVEVAPNVDWPTLADEHERRYGGFTEGDLYADVRDCLQELVDAGLGVVIAGNQPARRTAQLQSLDLPAHAIATSDDLGAGKPDPAFFAAVLDLADTDDRGRVLYVGDRVDNDVLPARRFGLRTCWLRRGPWGRLQDLPADTEPPDLVLEGLGELPHLVTTWRSGQDSQTFHPS